MIIQHTNGQHQEACARAENDRQNSIATAGGSAAAVKAADVAFYRALIASVKATGVQYAQFSETLRFDRHRRMTGISADTFSAAGGAVDSLFSGVGDL